MSKKKSTRKKQTKSFADVTINDFANSVTGKHRLKKSNDNVTTLIKQLETIKPWDEADDFDGDFDLVQEEDENGVVSTVLKKAVPQRLKNIPKSVNTTDVVGNSYPIDIWFLISEYIPPENVGKFAGICKITLDVVNSAKFWFSLYKRFYRSVPTLPERLQPECLLRRYGIRTSVIRSLYYMYPLFTNRLKSVNTFDRHPDELKTQMCILMWNKKQKGNWFYYFKFKEVLDSRRRRTVGENKQPDLLEMLEDVCANQDENCKILQVCCSHYVAFPPVLGLALTSASLNLAQSLRHFRLMLRFSSEAYACCEFLPDSAVTSIVLDSVVNLKILDWWHPQYPHNYNIDYLLNNDDK